MKKYLFLFIYLLILVLVYNNSYGQINLDWKWVNPKPQGNDIMWVKALSPDNWVAAGDYGTFMCTTNAGVNWTIYTNAGGTDQYTRQGKRLLGGWFFNMNTGLVCGSRGWIARTTNGGANWDSIAAAVPITTNLEGIYFINSTTGFISGSYGTILKSTNAGLTWTVIPTGITTSMGRIFALDINHIYAAGQNYLITTSNGGVNWISNTTQLYGKDVYFLNYNTGFVCGSGGMVKLTTNGGANWINKPTGSKYILYSLYGDVSSSGSSFFEGFDSIIFPPAGWKAVNVFGNSTYWVRTTAFPHSPPGCAWITYESDTVNGGLDWLITPKLSINTGDTLEFRLKPEYTGYPPDSLCVRVSTTDTALTSFTTRILYLAEGAGYPDSTAWTKYSVSLNSFAGQNIYIGFKHQDFNGDGIYLDDISLITQGAQTLKLYAGGDTGIIYVTTNLGDNWTPLQFMIPGHFAGARLSMDVNGSVIITGGSHGIFNSSTNYGTNWSAKNYRTSRATFSDVWCQTGTGKVWVVGSTTFPGSYFDQVMFSSNGGTTFAIQNVNGSTAGYHSISMVNDNTGYISGSLGAIRKTTNGGLSWDSLATPIPGTFLDNIDFVNANTGWVFSNISDIPGGSIWHTTNGGINWTQQTLADTTLWGQFIYAADMINPNTGFCVSGIPVIHKTTNGGLNWIPQNQSITDLIRDMSMLNEDSGYVCGNSNVYMTTNGWQNANTVVMPFNDEFESTSWLDFNNGFVLVNKGMVFRTTNGGNEWEFLPAGTGILYKIFAKTIDTAYVVGELGDVLKLQRGPVGITWKNSVPSQYFLGQNYPNPFNPVTEFKFGLAQKGKVSLKVYDILGKLVQTYFDNQQLNAGTVTVKFDGNNLASGVYFYSLNIDNELIDTKKMVLIK
ncbi:MAG: T9SS C-terminal target domain-containing protein [Ignavibacteriae bacterium]|nr:MAG: T9SS C-terminal target domain-containing protein [Ignavibacteriota bacterium]